MYIALVVLIVANVLLLFLLRGVVIRMIQIEERAKINEELFELLHQRVNIMSNANQMILDIIKKLGAQCI